MRNYSEDALVEQPAIALFVRLGYETINAFHEKPGKRGGSMTFAVTETEYRNATGALVARARAVGIETGQVVKD